MESPSCTGLSTFSRRCKALMSPSLSRSTRPGSHGASKRDRQRASPLITNEARGRVEMSLRCHTVSQQRYHGARCPAGLCRLSPGPYSSPGLPFFNSSRASLWLRPPGRAAPGRAASPSPGPVRAGRRPPARAARGVRADPCMGWRGGRWKRPFDFPILADRVVALGLAESYSYESIRRVLKKRSSSRG
jgi:hypothetical protein